MTENEAREILNGIDEVRGELPEDGNDVEVALMMAKDALEEIQQYRAIEYDLKERYHANVDIKLLIHHFIETVFEGEKHEGFCLLTNEDADMWNAYKAIGTVEEFKALKEKNVAKKVVKWADGSEHCPCCDFDNSAIGYGVCIECGQKLDWE